MSENKTIDLFTRDYEVSVWTLQDSYITTLKWSGSQHKGTIQNPQMSLSDDGTESFSFNIPMYLWIQDGDVMRKKENPLWYMVNDKDNPIIAQNMRKIKVIFNKTFGTEQDKKDNGEHVFEFLITKVENSHSSDDTVCTVSCEGLPFHELGKQGFKLELSGDVFTDHTYDYYEGKTWYDNFHHGHTELPQATLDYWMNEIGIGNKEFERIYTNDDVYEGLTSRTHINSNEWYYLVDMDVSSFSFDEDGNVRSPRKIYEDSFVGAWDNDLMPTRIIPVREKERLVDSNESNIYNLTQTIAETFEVFCRYEYTYDENYHIVGRTIIFYNNFVKDTEGKEFLQLSYPHTSQSITREYDSTDITTKMYVRAETDDSSVTGQISIIDTDANPTKEDYIMNFDYLHSINTISDEQYDAIEEYNKKMRAFNDGDANEIELATTRGQQVKSRTREGSITVPGYGSRHKYVFTFNINYTPTEGDIIIYKDKEYCYYVNGNTTGWYVRNKHSIRGITTMQEMLIAKQEHKIEVDAKLESYTNQKTLAVERLADAKSHIGGGEAGTTYTIDENAPTTVLIYKESNNSTYYARLSSNHTGINPKSIHVYQYWDSAEFAFPGIIDSNVPKVSELVVSSWASSYPSAAITKYKSIWNKKYPNNHISEDAVETKFKAWLAEANDFATKWSNSGKIPDTVSTAINADKLVDSVDLTTSLLNDPVAWIAACMGLASIVNVDIKDSNNTVQKVYMCKTIKFNTINYELVIDDNQNVTKDSWNTMVAARKAYVLQTGYGVKASYLTPSKSGISVDWSNSWVKQNGGKLSLSISQAGQATWTYDGSTHTGKTLQGLWKNHYKSQEPSFDKWLKNTFKSKYHENEVIGFKVETDSNQNVTGIKKLKITKDSCNKVYLTYTFNPITYYKNIADQWQTKIDKMDKLIQQYTTEQEDLEEDIDMLDLQIRNKLHEKNEVMREFDQMMGPALRESYWQPENYQSYGDIYSDQINRIYFNSEAFNANYIAQSPDQISAKFIWDSELFSGEEEGYYESSVNLNKQYYPCLNLKEFFKNKNQYITIPVNGSNVTYNFYDHLDKLCFSFYNDNFDKQFYENNTWAVEDPLYSTSNGQWYYKRQVDTIVTFEGTSDHSIHNYDVEVTREETDRVFYMNKASGELCFIHEKNNDVIYPVFMITGLDELDDETLHFVTKQNSTSTSANDAVIHPGAQPMLGLYVGDTFYSFGTVQSTDWLNTGDNTEIVYPRIRINSLQLNQFETALTVNTETLTTPEHYNIDYRSSNFYINIKPEVLFNTYGTPDSNIVRDLYFNTTIGGTGADPAENTDNYKRRYPWRLTYNIKNGGTYAYLDAIRILKENSMPQVSYTITPNILNREFVRTLYNNLGQIAKINDFELKLENVFGYISSINLDLDQPWNDSIEIKNYKNKFEDLFSNITAQVEEMKKNAGVLASFNAGTITDMPVIEAAIFNMITDTLTSQNSLIDQFLASHFDGHAIVVQELNNILSSINEVLTVGEDGLVELYNDVNESKILFGTFIENITALTKPKIWTGDPNNFTGNVKPGDILIGTDGKQYIATAYAGEATQTFAPYFDGKVSKIKGANVEWDADTGKVDITGEQLINIASGNTVTIAANEDIYLIGNRSVNIGGATINIGSAFDTHIDPTTGARTSHEIQGGINIVSSRIDTNDAATSGVWINPDKIEMLSSNIIMKGSDRILMCSSDNTVTGTSVMQISRSEGIFIASGKGIEIFTTNDTALQLDASDMHLFIAQNHENDSSISIQPTHIRIGAMSNSNNAIAVKITPEIFAIGATNLITNVVTSTITASTTTTGLRMTSNDFAIAIAANSNRTLLSLSTDGIIFAYAKLSGNTSYPFKKTGSLGNSQTMLDDNIEGSYVKINKEGIKLGSSAELYVNMNNFKLQTDLISGIKTTRFAVGVNLNDIDSTTLDGVGTNFTGIVYNSSGLFVSGSIHANSFILDNNVNNSIPQSAVDNLSTTFNDMSPGSTITKYMVSSSNSTHPAENSASWADNPSATTDSNPYLWTKTILRNVSNTRDLSITYSVSTESGGVTITKLYRVRKVTDFPALPTAHITQNGINIVDAWTTSMPQYYAGYKYYFTCEERKESNGNYSWTNLKLDYLVNAAGTAQYISSTIGPILENGLSSGTVGNVTYGVILGNISNSLPMLIGSNSGIHIAAESGSSFAQTMILDKDGIELYGKSFELVTRNANNTGNVNAVVINSTGITLASNKTLTVDTNNFKVNPAATGTGSLFYVGSNDGTTSYLKYQADGTFEVKGKILATSLSIGTESFDTAVSSIVTGYNYTTLTAVQALNYTTLAGVAAAGYTTFGADDAAGVVWAEVGTNSSHAGWAISKTGAIAITASGGMTVSTKNFTLDANGNATFSGALSAASGSFAGSLSAATGTFTGKLNVGSKICIGSSDSDTETTTIYYGNTKIGYMGYDGSGGLEIGYKVTSSNQGFITCTSNSLNLFGREVWSIDPFYTWYGVVLTPNTNRWSGQSSGEFNVRLWSQVSSSTSGKTTTWTIRLKAALFKNNSYQSSHEVTLAEWNDMTTTS